MKRTRLRALIAAAVTVLLATFLAGTAGTAAAAANLLANPGFETGTLSGWTCSSTDHVAGPTPTARPSWPRPRRPAPGSTSST